jgi:hypothetical protein
VQEKSARSAENVTDQLKAVTTAQNEKIHTTHGALPHFDTSEALQTRLSAGR